MSAEDDVDLLKVVGTYKHGSIRSIKMHNFLTYGDVECRPGPRLNMVVGPNGTGKSTILCGICLGLGGEPRLLGRATDVETFIMNGEDEATIEVELASDNAGANPVIKRIIRRHPSKDTPKSSFFLDNEPVSAKRIRKLVLEDYNISVDNLCTFLPQDRVGSFSGFDAKALLMETEKSLSPSQHLFHQHQELIQLQQELESGNSNVETLQERVQQLEVENQRLEREKSRMEERELALEQAKLLRQKLLWLQFEMAKEAIYVTRDKKKEVKARKKQVEEEIAPLVEEFTRFDEQARRLDTRYKTLEQQVNKHKKEMEKQSKKYESHDDGIESTLAELSMMESRRSQQEQQVELMRQKVDSLRAESADVPPLQSVKEEHELALEATKAARPKYDEARRQLRQAQEQHKELQEQHKIAQTKMNRLQDDQARRNDRIFRQQPKLHEVYKWIDSNRSMFRKRIHGPIVCEITTKSKNAAAYLEQHVPNATLKSFVVESKEDYDLLYHNVREKLKLPINIIVIDRFKEQQPRLYSDAKMAILKRDHGVVGYMDESFTAPDVILEALKNKARVHKVLVGDEQTQESLNNKNLLGYLTQTEGAQDKLQSCCIFASEGNRSFKYQSNISKYNGKASTKIDEIKPAQWLAPGVSEDAKQKVDDELKEIEQQLDNVTPDLEAAKQKMVDLQEENHAATDRVRKAQEELALISKLMSKINNAERKLKEAERQLDVDDDDERSRLIASLKNRISHSITALEAHAESHKCSMETTYKMAGVRMDCDKAAIEVQRAERAKQEKEADLVETKREYEKIDRALKRQMEDARALKEKAEEEAPLVDENNEPLPLKAQLEDLPLDNVEEAQAALEEAEEKANDIIADPDVIRQYQDRRRELEDAQAQLDILTGSKEDKLKHIDRIRKPWEAALRNNMSEVNELFARYMSELGCTGEVQLTKGDDESDDSTEAMRNFKDYGIQIKVSFRQGTKAQVLSARVQSGGERSVSTIMYLMALQGMMVAPFRCVDEINQGLDDRNERLVFRRIVQNSTQPPGPKGPTDHCGQYFLITPKLLPNLFDMEVEAITVLFILNGPYNFKSPSDWDIPHFLELRKRSTIESAAANDDENTPNSQTGEVPRKPKRARKSND